MYIQMVGILGRSPLSYRYPPCPSASKCKSSSFQMNQLGITSVPFKLPRYKKYLLAHCFPFQSQFLRPFSGSFDVKFVSSSDNVEPTTSQHRRTPRRRPSPRVSLRPEVEGQTSQGQLLKVGPLGQTG